MATVHCIALYRDDLLHTVESFGDASQRDAFALTLAVQPGDVVTEWVDSVPALDLSYHVLEAAISRDYTPSTRYTVPQPQSGR
jgi:hypothetical protein